MTSIVSKIVCSIFKISKFVIIVLDRAIGLKWKPLEKHSIPNYLKQDEKLYRQSTKERLFFYLPILNVLV